MVTTEQIIGLLGNIPENSPKWAVGNDLVALPGFRISCTPQFIRRVFTPEEIRYCTQFSDPTLRYASTWAAKEAVYKALKQLDEHQRLWWRDIRISRNKPAGKPAVCVPKLPFPIDCSLSISHDGAMVWAVAVIQRKTEDSI